MSIPNESQPNASRFSKWHIRLRQTLENYFDENDIEILCFDLHFDYESLAGAGKTRKIVELIKGFARRGRIGELIDYCSQQRPNIPWTELREAAVINPLAVDSEPDEGGANRTLRRPENASFKQIRSPSANRLSACYLVVIGIAAVMLVGLFCLVPAVFIIKPHILFPATEPISIMPSPTAVPTTPVPTTPSLTAVSKTPVPITPSILPSPTTLQPIAGPTTSTPTQSRICTTYISNDSRNALLITCSNDGTNWSGNAQLGIQSSKAAPAMAVFNGKLCVTYVANNPGNVLLITCSSNGIDWSGGTGLLGVGHGDQSSNAGPAMAVFNGKLCVTYVANNPGNGLLITCSNDGTDWSGKVLLGIQSSKAAPAMAVFNGKLCVTYVANNEGNVLLITCSSNGVDWSGGTGLLGVGHGDQSSNAGPAMAVFNGKLCVTYVANNPGNGLLITCSNDGTDWSGKVLLGIQSSKAAPAMAVFNGKLCVTYVANNPGNVLLITCSSNGIDWSGWTGLLGVGHGDQSSNAGPAMAVFGPMR